MPEYVLPGTPEARVAERTFPRLEESAIERVYLSPTGTRVIVPIPTPGDPYKPARKGLHPASAAIGAAAAVVVDVLAQITGIL